MARLNYVQDTNGNRITASYTNGLLTRLTHSSGQFLTLAYNAAGLVSTITDSAGRTTTYHYDPTNQYLTSVVDFDGQTTSYTYDTGTNPATAHALLSVTHPDGSHDYFSYDAQGRLADAHRDGGAEDTTFTYNEGQVSVTDALGDTTTYSFDNRGLLVQVENPLGRHGPLHLRQQLQPDPDDGRRGPDLHQHLRHLRRPAQLDRPARPHGHLHLRLHRRPAGLGHRRERQHDHVRLRRQGQPDLDDLRRRHGRERGLRPDRQRAELDRPAWARPPSTPTTRPATSSPRPSPTARRSSSPTTPTRTSPAPPTRAARRPDLRRERPPDPDHLPERPLPEVQLRRGRPAHADGRPDRLHGELRLRRRRQPGDADRRLGQPRSSGTPTTPSAASAARTTATAPTSTYAYDAAGELLHLVNYAPDGTVNSRFDYTYDNLGRRITEATLDGTWTYTYDAIGELTHAVFASTNPAIANQDLAYAYDAAGNRTQTIINGVTTVYTTNNLNEYTQVGDTQYSYDADGNLISATDASGTTNYTYNDQNQLVGVTGRAGRGRTSTMCSATAWRRRRTGRRRST